MREFKVYGRALMIAATLSPLAACNTSPEAAFKDARVQIGYEKAGFEARRDAGALLATAAANARTPETIVRYNRTYAEYAIDHGQQAEAYKAYERAALAGDRTSGRRLAKGHLDGIYRPSDVNRVARSVDRKSVV